MIIVTIKENETIDKALKRFKKKFEKTGVLKELRSRSFFQKPSVKKRQANIKSAYKYEVYGNEAGQSSAKQTTSATVAAQAQQQKAKA